MDLADVCRTCFSPDNLEYTIFDVIPLENQPSEIMVIDLLGLIPRISITDISPPLRICTKCMEFMKLIYTFISQCEKSETYIRQLQTQIFNDQSNQNVEQSSMSSALSPTINNGTSGGISIKLERSLSTDQFLEEKPLNTQDDFKDSTEYKFLSSKETIPPVAIKQEPELELWEDIELVPEEESYQLPAMDQVSSSSNLNSSDENVQKGFQCSCGERFSRKLSYSRHVKNCLPLYECDICSMAFQDKTSAFSHFKTSHPGEKPAITENNQRNSKSNRLTNKNTSILPERVQVFVTEEATKYFPCKYCSKQLKTEKSRAMHMRVHNSKHKCEECNKHFRTGTHLRAHEMRVHPGKWNAIQCGICERYFACKSDYFRHQLTHTKETPFECNMCPQKYRYKKFLENHMRQSHDINEEELQEFLKEKYGRKSWLSGTFTCDICSMEMVRADVAAHLENHMLNRDVENKKNKSASNNKNH
ncbi:unnamed protein product [Hermetia illucens]|uniref:Uncharacterized protein n=1 Tax=Hermetia illucens TaxID=343691 RepID=A0A7R8YT15_HERIL|nr:zinc finger protein 345-like [Hermetia illucens]CAD7081209.1 unnamed protein product [Hermetia illucens]